MNKKLNLVEILKNCPEGTKFYSTIFGEVAFCYVDDVISYPIVFTRNDGNTETATSDGRFFKDYDGECSLFPSKDQRDWSNFTAPWYKKEKFDPKTLKPFDKVLVRTHHQKIWHCDFFSHISDNTSNYPYITITADYIFCIPYNEDTKHLVGTTEEAPEYYRYWED